MAGKRGASSELNHDNWEQDDEPEERGTFQKASESALKTRVIKTAKRRNPIRSEDQEKPSVFAGFNAFSNKPSSGDFSFLKNISSSNSIPKSNGIDKPESTTTSSGFSFSNVNSVSQSNNIFGAPVKTTASSIGTNIFGSSTSTKNATNTIVPSETSVNKKSETYLSKLKGLNESVSKWIAKKVEENPLISLQPIFKDYERYINEIEKEESSESNDKPKSSEPTDKPKLSESNDKPKLSESNDKPTNVNSTKPIPTFNFIPSEDKNTKAIPDSTSEKPGEKKDESPIPTFKFGGPMASVSSSGPTYSFGSASGGVSQISQSNMSTTTTAPTFSFGSKTSSGSLSFPSSSGFSFGGLAKPAEAEKSKQGGDDNNENDEDEPPKVEFKPVVEKDHVYTIRCKVFVKKGDSFGDRGVGNLYLKPIENSEKLQLIVRADTNLGNLLLNFILSESVPTKRMGKKDVMLVAIPTPDAKPPPVPLLLRVKSPEEADNLLEVLEKHKK